MMKQSQVVKRQKAQRTLLVVPLGKELPITKCQDCLYQVYKDCLLTLLSVRARLRPFRGYSLDTFI